MYFRRMPNRESGGVVQPRSKVMIVQSAWHAVPVPQTLIKDQSNLYYAGNCIRQFALLGLHVYRTRLS